MKFHRLLAKSFAAAAFVAALAGINPSTAIARPIDGLDCNAVMDAWVHSSQSLDAAKAAGHQSEIRFWQQEYNANERWIRVNC